MMTMTSSKELQELLQVAQQGDMIKFNRGSYSHWGIFVGGDEIIHRWGDNDGIGHSLGLRGNITTIFGVEFDKAKIEKSKISVVLKYGGKVRVDNYLDSKQTPLPIEIILEKANSALGLPGYNLIYNNCEHFATECRYGQPNSHQVQIVVGSLVAGVAITALVAGGAYLLHRSSQTKEEENEEQNQNVKYRMSIS